METHTWNYPLPRCDNETLVNPVSFHANPPPPRTPPSRRYPPARRLTNQIYRVVTRASSRSVGMDRGEEVGGWVGGWLGSYEEKTAAAETEEREKE